jgi:2-polyprenyl-6-methoxyphenol hydroxylase-like FAD-dependent oxidoreductase
MDLTGTRVTVVGAGIGGMAAALMFARMGAGVVVLERSADIRAVGAGLLLQPNGLAVLSALGERPATGVPGSQVKRASGTPEGPARPVAEVAFALTLDGAGTTWRATGPRDR